VENPSGGCSPTDENSATHKYIIWRADGVYLLPSGAGQSARLFLPSAPNKGSGHRDREATFRCEKSAREVQSSNPGEATAKEEKRDARRRRPVAIMGHTHHYTYFLPANCFIPPGGGSGGGCRRMLMLLDEWKDAHFKQRALPVLK